MGPHADAHGRMLLSGAAPRATHPIDGNNNGGAAMNQTVVIVDQNPTCARLYRAMLEPLPCRVLVARSAQEAADLIEHRWRFDSAEPEAEPKDAAGAPRPLILMAGLHPAEHALQVAHSTGAEAIFVRKPVAGDGLAALVRRHFRGTP